MKALGKHLPQKLRMTNSGFTLIELMVTIAVLAIIVSIAAPSISTQLANQRVKSTTATLENALKEAKVESIIRRQEVKLSYSNNGDRAGTIKIEDDSSNIIATYQYDVKSKIKPNNKQIKFKPNKTVDLDGKKYNICDSNTAATTRQISINNLGVISSQVGGSC